MIAPFFLGLVQRPFCAIQQGRQGFSGNVLGQAGAHAQADGHFVRIGGLHMQRADSLQLAHKLGARIGQGRLRQDEQELFAPNRPQISLSRSPLHSSSESMTRARSPASAVPAKECKLVV